MITRKFVESMRRGEAGQSVIILALGFIALLAFVGIVTDVSLMFVRYSSLRRAVDSASIAAAGQMRKDRSLATVSLAARQFIEFHGLNPKAVLVESCATVPDRNNDGVQNFDDDPELCTADQRKLVRVTAQLDSPTVFLRLLGWDNIVLEASALSETAVLDVVLILDVSESMMVETTYQDWVQVNQGYVFRPPSWQEIRDAKGITTIEMWQGPAGNPEAGLLNVPQQIVNQRLTYVNAPSLDWSGGPNATWPVASVPDPDYQVRSFVLPGAPAGQTLPRVECTVRFFPYSLAFQVPSDVDALYTAAGMAWPGSAAGRWQGFVPTYSFYGCCNDPTKGATVDLEGNIDMSTWIDNSGDGLFNDLVCQPFKQARDATRQFLQRVDFLRGDRVAFVTFGRSAYILNPYSQADQALGKSHMIDNFGDAVNTLNQYVGVRSEPNFYNWDEINGGWTDFAAGFDQNTGDSLVIDFNATDLAAKEYNDYPVRDNCPFQNAALPFPYSRYASLRRIMYPNDVDPVTGNNTVWMGTPLSVANSYELWGSCRDTNIGAALREANNALLDPRTSRREGVWVMILLSDGAAGASDPVRRNGEKREAAKPYQETFPGSGIYGLPGEYGAFGLCPAGTPSQLGELVDTADEVAAGIVAFPFCSDEVPETRHFCNFRPDQDRNGVTWQSGIDRPLPISGHGVLTTNNSLRITHDNDYVSFDPPPGALIPFDVASNPAYADYDLNGDGVVNKEEEENLAAGNIYDVDIGDYPTACDQYYDVDDYARDWADYVGLLQEGQGDEANLPTIFTIAFGLDYINGSSGTPGDPGYVPGPPSANIESYLGEELLRYIADVGDNNQMDIDYQQDWLDNGLLDLQLAGGELFGSRSVCEGPGGAKFNDIYASQADMIEPLGPTENCGNYFNAPGQNELEIVFDEIASRMFTRLAG